MDNYFAKFKMGFVVATFLVVTHFPSVTWAHDGPHEALSKVNYLLEKNPDNRDLLLRQSHCLSDLGRYDEALDVLNRLVHEDSESEEYRIARALLHRDREEYKQAVLDLDAALSLGRRIDEVYRIRAEVYCADGQAEKALEDYKAAAQYFQDENFYNSYALYLEEQEQFEQAHLVFQAGLKVHTISELLQQNISKYLIRQKEYAQALKGLDTFIQKAAFKTNYLLMKAECQRGLKQEQDAARTLQQALDECNSFLRRRERPIHRYYRARVYLMQHELDAAMDDVMLVLKRAPKYKDAIILKQEIETAQKGQ